MFLAGRFFLTLVKIIASVASILKGLCILETRSQNKFSFGETTSFILHYTMGKIVLECTRFSGGFAHRTK